MPFSNILHYPKKDYEFLYIFVLLRLKANHFFSESYLWRSCLNERLVSGISDPILDVFSSLAKRPYLSFIKMAPPPPPEMEEYQTKEFRPKC